MRQVQVRGNVGRRHGLERHAAERRRLGDRLLGRVELGDGVLELRVRALGGGRELLVVRVRGGDGDRVLGGGARGLDLVHARRELTQRLAVRARGGETLDRGRDLLGRLGVLQLLDGGVLLLGGRLLLTRQSVVRDRLGQTRLQLGLGAADGRLERVLDTLDLGGGALDRERRKEHVRGGARVV